MDRRRSFLACGKARPLTFLPRQTVVAPERRVRCELDSERLTHSQTRALNINKMTLRDRNIVFFFLTRWEPCLLQPPQHSRDSKKGSGSSSPVPSPVALVLNSRPLGTEPCPLPSSPGFAPRAADDPWARPDTGSPLASARESLGLLSRFERRPIPLPLPWP